jgi:hypothetical protein
MMSAKFADAPHEMKVRITHWIAIALTAAAWIAGTMYFGACTTAEIAPKAPLPELPPAYVQVPHPAGYAMSDLRAIFTTPLAPKPADLKDCDADFKKLHAATQSTSELLEGARELVRRDPVKYHWCFYGKVMELEDYLKADSYLDEKQKAVLDTYAILTPMARAFMEEYHDSRYVRWGVRHYRSVSEWVFYRKVEMTPQMTSELVEASNPFGLLKDSTPDSPVLEKYGIARAEPVALPPAAENAAALPPTMPATQPAVPVAGASAPSGAAQAPAADEATAQAAGQPDPAATAAAAVTPPAPTTANVAAAPATAASPVPAPDQVSKASDTAPAVEPASADVKGPAPASEAKK